MKSKFFSFITSKEVIKLQDNMPHIKEVISIIVEPEILSQKVVNTIKGTSIEGQYLSGKKIVFQIKLKQKILYIADNKEETIHTIEDEYYQSAYIVIPDIIKGSNPKDLLKLGYLKTKINVQNTSMSLINKRTIFKNIVLYINAYLIPTYELSFTIQNKSKNSNIFISYGDCSNNKQLTFNGYNNIKPLWSPTGLHLGFLCDLDNNRKYMLYVYFLKENIIKKINTPSNLSSITSFCWSLDGQEIIFSALSKNKKDIFCININTFKSKQLTYGNGNIKSYNPRICPKGEKIAFLESICKVSNLCIMDINGSNIKKITSSGYIKDFDWSLDGNFITYIYGKSDIKDKIYTLNLSNYEAIPINTPENIINIRNVKYSPNNKFVSFIASDLISDNIYVYDVKNKDFINLTKTTCNMKIKDFVWKTDSSVIYYSGKKFNYYNIYCLSLNNYSSSILTNTQSNDIKLSFRSKII